MFVSNLFNAEKLKDGLENAFLIRLITIPAKNENFDVKKWFQIFFFGQASSDYKKIVIQ